MRRGPRPATLPVPPFAPRRQTFDPEQPRHEMLLPRAEQGSDDTQLQAGTELSATDKPAQNPAVSLKEDCVQPKASAMRGGPRADSDGAAAAEHSGLDVDGEGEGMGGEGQRASFDCDEQTPAAAAAAAVEQVGLASEGAS